MNKPNQTGLNFCPQCGCNIGLVNRAMELALPQIPKAHESKAPEEEPARRPKLSSEEIVRRADKGVAEGRKLKDIMEEMGLSAASIYPHRRKVEYERAKAALAKAHAPRTAPALVQPKPKRVLSERALPSGSITQEQKEEMRRRKAAGESISQIAQSMGFKIGTVGPIIYARKPKLKPGTEAAA